MVLSSLFTSKTTSLWRHSSIAPPGDARPSPPSSCPSSSSSSSKGQPLKPQPLKNMLAPLPRALPLSIMGSFNPASSSQGNVSPNTSSSPPDNASLDPSPPSSSSQAPLIPRLSTNQSLSFASSSFSSSFSSSSSSSSPSSKTTPGNNAAPPVAIDDIVMDHALMLMDLYNQHNARHPPERTLPSSMIFSCSIIVSQIILERPLCCPSTEWCKGDESWIDFQKCISHIIELATRQGVSLRPDALTTPTTSPASSTCNTPRGEGPTAPPQARDDQEEFQLINNEILSITLQKSKDDQGHDDGYDSDDESNDIDDVLRAYGIRHRDDGYDSDDHTSAPAPCPVPRDWPTSSFLPLSSLPRASRSSGPPSASPWSWSRSIPLVLFNDVPSSCSSE
eukprot:TRINITY_DN1313_c0_g1_i2.p1 TRINITY_DN1313_c0_g1~~TRINITY_DN1313_c0_g1_i2.p1  ORF type:complete len:392 (+),score=126.34 TRINITY_DN1313_c0_g1_i2:286-1461(+)